MTTASTERKAKWRKLTDAGLVHLTGGWVSKDDWNRLQPKINEAVDAEQPKEPT